LHARLPVPRPTISLAALLGSDCPRNCTGVRKSGANQGTANQGTVYLFITLKCHIDRN
jgi:hypothetical protein